MASLALSLGRMKKVETTLSVFHMFIVFIDSQLTEQSLAPKKFDYFVTLSPLVELPKSEEPAQKQRDVPYVPPSEPKGLKMRYEPYGFNTGEALVLKEDKEQDSHSKKRKSETEGKGNVSVMSLPFQNSHSVVQWRKKAARRRKRAKPNETRMQRVLLTALIVKYIRHHISKCKSSRKVFPKKDYYY
jgi:hypothetical protein